MPENEKLSIAGIRTGLEEIWATLDILFADMSPADWERPHGEDWVFADLPYHLAYIDRLFVSQPIEKGAGMPEAGRFELRSFGEIDAWNQARFAERPESQPVTVSLDQMHASRHAVRQAIAGMTDADLDRPAWFPAMHMRGMRSALISLAFCLGHTWQHLEEARIRLGRTGTRVSPDWTRILLNGILPGVPYILQIPTIPLFLDASRAWELGFSIAVNVSGSGGATWRFQPSESGWQGAQSDSAGANLALSMGLDAYINWRFFIRDLDTLVEAGDITANNAEALDVFRSLLTPPDPNFIFPILP